MPVLSQPGMPPWAVVLSQQRYAVEGRFPVLGVWCADRVPGRCGSCLGTSREPSECGGYDDHMLWRNRRSRRERLLPSAVLYRPRNPGGECVMYPWAWPSPHAHHLPLGNESKPLVRAA